MHVGGPSGTRGAFSLYVPESLRSLAGAWPLVVALHGGSGNGGAFLWSWVREARTREVSSCWRPRRSAQYVVADGSRMIDGPLHRRAWPPASQATVERRFLDVKLLTGMSDGGTFTYVIGLARRLSASRISHRSPRAFHPMLMSLRRRRIACCVTCRSTSCTVTAGLDVSRRRSRARVRRRCAFAGRRRRSPIAKIADLSHTYPRDENGGILDWFMSSGPRASRPAS